MNAGWREVLDGAVEAAVEAMRDAPACTEHASPIRVGGRRWGGQFIVQPATNCAAYVDQTIGCDACAENVVKAVAKVLQGAAP